MVKVGMTIEKIIKKLLWFEDYNEEDYCGGDRIQDEHGDWFYKVTEEDFEAFRQAADVMRKYQKLEQEPKTAHWYIDERPESDREVICSNCEQSVFKYHKLDFDYRPKFCPNCGAKMVEPQESEDKE